MSPILPQEHACMTCSLYSADCIVDSGATACQSCAACGYECEFERILRVRVSCAGLHEDLLAGGVEDARSVIPLVLLQNSETGSVQMLFNTPQGEACFVELPALKAHITTTRPEYVSAQLEGLHDRNDFVLGQPACRHGREKPPDQLNFVRDIRPNDQVVPPDIPVAMEIRKPVPPQALFGAPTSDSSLAVVSNGLLTSPHTPELAMRNSVKSSGSNSQQAIKRRSPQEHHDPFPIEALLECKVANCQRRGDYGFQQRDEWRNHMRFEHGLEPIEQRKTKRRLDRDNFRLVRKFGACEPCKTRHIKCEHAGGPKGVAVS